MTDIDDYGAVGGSFWEPGNYRRATQRIADGRRLCKDLVSMLKERADIERAYAKELHGWANKWAEFIKNVPEYGTTRVLWNGIIIEAEKLADLHLRIKDKLSTDIIMQVKTWRKETYHKKMLQIKEKKEMEESFKNAQKPWEKLFRRVEDAKLDYHEAFRNERSIFHQLRNAFSDSDMSLTQVKKIQERSVHSREILKKAKDNYEESLNDIHEYNPKYIDDMTAVFNKCQEIEGARLQFFKKMMFSIHKCLDLSQNPTYQQIYEEFCKAIDNANPEKDLQWWSQKFGIHMQMMWPIFEEYQEGWREIVKGKQKTEVATGTTLTNWRAVGEDAYESSLPNKKGVTSAQEQKDNSDQNTTKAKGNVDTNTYNVQKVNKLKTNPFEEDETDDEDTSEIFVNYAEPGIPVRALYDYQSREDDELNFKEGDIFDKLEDQDEQGWCKGRKDGRIGLYPANYVEILE